MIVILYTNTVIISDNYVRISSYLIKHLILLNVFNKYRGLVLISND